MSFNNITLPKTAIADIYKYYLVEIIARQGKNNVKAITDVAAMPEYTTRFLGKNLKNILILVHYTEIVHLPDEHLDFLKKILIACKLSIEDIAIINTARERANVEDIGLLSPGSILIFGECVSNILNGEKINFFNPEYRNEILIMTAPALEKLFMTTTESKQLKSKLWLSLQQFFKL